MGLSQRGFAQVLGVHPNTVLAWEGAKSRPRAVMVVHLKELWGIHAKSMFSGCFVPQEKE